MTSMPKRVLYGSIGLMSILSAVTLLDMATGWVFARAFTMDILFLVGAAMVIYLAIDALNDQKK